MFRLEKTKKNRKAVITLTGNATIEHAGEIKNELKTLLEGSKEVKLDLTALEKADVSFLQLLESLCKTCISSEKTLSLSENHFPDVLDTIITTAGFFKQRQCLLNPDSPCLLNEISKGLEQ